MDFDFSEFGSAITFKSVCRGIYVNDEKSNMIKLYGDFSSDNSKFYVRKISGCHICSDND